MKKIANFFKYLVGSTENQQRDRRKTEAETKINVTYKSKDLYITIDSIPLLRITNETDVKNGTIAMNEASALIELIKMRYIDRLY